MCAVCFTRQSNKTVRFFSVVVRAKSPSDAWSTLKSIVNSENCTTASKKSKKNFEKHSMVAGESTRE